MSPWLKSCKKDSRFKKSHHNSKPHYVFLLKSTFFIKIIQLKRDKLKEKDNETEKVSGESEEEEVRGKGSDLGVQ